MLTAEQIAEAKNAVRYRTTTTRHEHDDCVRIAYAWLDAQVKNRNRTAPHYLPLKHVIETWGGRYISEDDVVVAAHLHPDIRGTYPTYNLSKRLTLPRMARLDGIAEAGTMPNYRRKLRTDRYAIQEDSGPTASAA